MTPGALPDTPPAPSDLQAALAATQEALHASQQREAALRRELAHQVRNALSITRSVFSRTMDNAPSIEHARDHFSGRLDALARYQGRFAATPTSDLDLEVMVRDELMVFASGGDQRIEVAGPSVRLAPGEAAVIGLALHELATNSVKFGVLGEPASKGWLRITWTRQDKRVRLEWAESGVPIIATAPIASGFGREYIEQAVPYQLGAETSFELAPGGIVCWISFDSKDNPGSDPSPI
jgi:two-component system CheB/CheR fusion protein